ncbi:ABC-2 type transporter [Cynara cardunculus var. scolymus]|uniref:ABC-2 type transporter n=1 Tax=Cynara cardunculus var. scolymus TaxID=59895 RepID=A0A118JVT8_CYNCS|nr:ABC-2 type transporter [Cynara cardunculus var. scolymus]
MTVFLRTEMSRDTLEDGWIYMGCLFFGVVMIMFNGMPEISMTIAKLPVFYKQRDFLFYPSWAYALPTWIVKIPISFVEAAVWTTLTYYVVGLEPNITRFFRLYFILFGVNQMSSALFRFIGALGRNMIVANTFGSFALLLVFVLGGFVLSQEHFPCYRRRTKVVVMGLLVISDDKVTGIGSRSWRCSGSSFSTISVSVCASLFSTNGNDTGATELSPTAGSPDRSNGTKKKGMILPFEPHFITFNDVKYSLFLLKRGGEEIYVGPVGRHSCDLIKYFEDIDGVSRIKDGHNPATWMLEISTSAQEMALGVNFSEIYMNSELFTRNKALIAELSIPPPGTKDLYFPTQYAQPFVVQCIASLWKQRWSYWRNPSYTAVRFAFTTFIAFMFGTMFWDLGRKRKTPQELNNAMGSMYAAVLFLGVQNGSAVQPVIDVERTVLVEIPYIFAQTIVYSLIVYAMIGFEWTATKFFWYTFFQFCCLLYMTFYGMMTVAITPNVNVAFIVAAAFFGFFNLFSGFIIPRPKIPVWWKWYYWCNPLAWTIYGMAASQFGDYEDRFTNGETVKGYLERYLGYRHDFLGQTVAGNIGFVLFFGFIFAYCIKTFNFQKR